MEDELASLSIIFTEFYYWVTVALMFLIHAGFLMYEAGSARRKNVQHTVMKNVMLIPVVTLTFFLFGWWIYFAFPTGPFIYGGLVEAGEVTPWSEFMGTHMEDRITLVFWAAFLLFSWTAASIVSGSVLERIKTSGFLVLAVLIGSVFWIIDAAWGWHPEGWMVQIMGYHDAYASGVIHAVAGGFALGVIVVLGPRIGKFGPDGEPRDIPPHNIWMRCVGLFVIYTGFWGFYVACNVPILDVGADGEPFFSATNIYLMPTTLSAITGNFLMSLTGGLLMAFLISRGDPFWTFSGGLAGIIAASAGNDLYHPIQAMLIGAVGVVIAYKLHYWVERRFKIDDVVGAVAVHGYAGAFGVVIAGFMLWGYPAAEPVRDGLAWFTTPDGWPAINPIGQILGAFIMFGVLGFLPGYVAAKILHALGQLRVPPEIELAGLDTHLYGDVHPYFEQRETAFEHIERAEAAELLPDLYPLRPGNSGGPGDPDNPGGGDS